jgi:lipoate-protein ligase A
MAALLQLAPVSACAEQVWNEAQFERPVVAPAWRLWRYDRPAVVLGCSQRRLLASAQDETALDMLVRGSGGGAVLVGPWMLGLSVVLPSTHRLVRGGAVESYRWLGEGLAEVLRAGGIDAQALAPAAARRSDADGPVPDWACFAGLSPWEVVVGRRKIVGLAQVRRRHGVLLVAGLLLDTPDWPRLCRALGRPAADAGRLAELTTSWAAERGQAAPVLALVGAIERCLGAALRRGDEEAKEKRLPLRQGLACAAA